MEKKQQSGFTLYELLVVMLITGILAAIAAPNFLGMINKGRVNESANVLRGMIQNVQREAIKKSKNCTIQLPATGTENPVVTTDCAIADRSRTLKNVAIQYNGIGNTIAINYKGGISVRRTIVLYSNQTSHQRCLVVSNGIGMVRAGKYTGTDLTNLDGNAFCKKDEI